MLEVERSSILGRLGMKALNPIVVLGGCCVHSSGKVRETSTLNLKPITLTAQPYPIPFLYHRPSKPSFYLLLHVSHLSRHYWWCATGFSLPGHAVQRSGALVVRVWV